MGAIESGELAELERRVREFPGLLEFVPEDGQTLLHKAAGSASLRHDDPGACVRWLLDAGMRPDAGRTGFDTALHFAASLNHVDAVDALLEAGAPTGCVGGCDDQADGGTPLAHALVYGAARAADRIAAVAIEPRNLRVTAGLGRLDLVRDAFAPDGSLKPEAREARAFYRPHDEFPEWEPSDERQEILDEALVWAAHNARDDAVLEELIERGADPSAVPYVASGLHYAAWRGDTRVVETLLAKGADASRLDRQYGAPVWSWAAFGGHDELRLRLLEVAAKSCLAAAVELGSIDDVRRLLDGGADPNEGLEGHDGPLALARCAGDDAIASLLARRGATLSLEEACRLGDLARVVEALDGEGTGERGAERLSRLADDAAAAGREEVADVLCGRGAVLSPHAAASLGRVEPLEAALQWIAEQIAGETDAKTGTDG